MTDHPTHYTPAHGKRKVLAILVGLLIFFYGLSQLWLPLSLVFFGARATGEATRVIKTKPGLPDQAFSDDLHLKTAEETRDRSYIFWNEFQFTSADGATHLVRLDIGSQLKPLYPLLDDDGLPSNVPIYYDPAHPDRFCVPDVLSTWYAPVLITGAGLLCVGCGLLLLYWARHPIEIS